MAAKAMILFLLAIGVYLVSNGAQALVEGTLADARLLAEVLRKGCTYWALVIYECMLQMRSRKKSERC